MNIDPFCFDDVFADPPVSLTGDIEGVLVFSDDDQGDDDDQD